VRELEALLRRSGPGVGEILDVLGDAVTIRDRDTMVQSRVPIEELVDVVRDRVG